MAVAVYIGVARMVTMIDVSWDNFMMVVMIEMMLVTLVNPKVILMFNFVVRCVPIVMFLV